VAAVVGVIAMMHTGAGESSPQSVYAFAAPFYGSTGLVALNQPITAMASLPDGSGYWLVTKEGQVSPFGAAPWLGGLEVDPAHPVVGIAVTPSGRGYWLATSDGDLHVFGDAAFYGSLVGVVGSKDVVGIAANPAGGGYWLVTTQGNVYSYGTAALHGSMDSMPLNGPIVGIAPSASGNGYWLAGRDGGVFTFGDATFHGSMGATRLARAVTGIARTSSGNGYLLAGSDGGVFAFGDAPFHGSLAADPLPEPIVAVAAAPAGGYWLATTGHLAPATSPRPPTNYLANGTNTIGNSAYVNGRPTTYRQLNPSTDPLTPCQYGIVGADDLYRFVSPLSSGDGRNVVRLRTTDTGFVSVGCGTWSSDLFPATPSLDSLVGNGTWLLGIDIRSGTWHAPGGSACTWRTIADLSGLSTGTIQVGGSLGPQTVSLVGSEVAFVSSGCGMWTPA
jgi:hypothetical protein